MEKLYKNLPDTPGVYLMRDANGSILYVGKAANLKRRVSSYFTRPHDRRIKQLVSEIRKIDYQPTETAIEALILEASLIKEHLPPYNVREKDDKSFLYVEITREKFPRVLLVRGKDALRTNTGAVYGPFTSASSIREALKILRRIFPYSIHAVMAGSGRDEKGVRPCFDSHLSLCPGTCAGLISRTDYAKNIRNLKRFFGGQKHQIIRSFEREMRAASKRLDFETAERCKRKIFALKHIQDVALIQDDNLKIVSAGRAANLRIEGYDISNISGTSAVGSMVVFVNGEPDRGEYRKFKIRTIVQSNDVGMLREVLRRRLENSWPLPNIILVDGGKPQVGAVRETLEERGVRIPVVGLVKGPERKRNDFVGAIPYGVDPEVLIRVRDEAHRFAISYHRNLRRGNQFA